MRTREYIQHGESEGKSLVDAMNDGGLDGMQTFDMELERLWREGVITHETAISYASNAPNLALRMSGIASTSREGNQAAQGAEGAKDAEPANDSEELGGDSFADLDVKDLME